MTRRSPRRSQLAAGCALAAFLLPLALQAHPHRPIAVKIDPQDARRLLVLEQGGGAPRTLYETDADAVVGAAVSPYFSRVAVVEAKGPVNRVTLIDAGGRRLGVVDRNVRRLIFSPDGRRIAFITGSRFEGGAGFSPEAAFVFDVDSGRQQEIAGAEQAYDLDWVATPSEEALYLRLLSGGVARYDFASGALERLESPLFNISPDGEYYFSRPAENVEMGRCAAGRGDDSCFRLHRRETNETISFFSTAELGTPLGWVYGDGHNLLVSRKSYRTEEAVRQVGGAQVRGRLIAGVSEARALVFDVETQQVREEFDCEVAGLDWAGDWLTGARGIACADSPDGTYVRTREPVPAVAAAPPAPGPAGPPSPAPGRPEPNAAFNYSNPVFSWDPVEGAVAYGIEICATSRCGAGEVVSGAADVRDTRWQPRALPKGEFFWRLTSVDAGRRPGPPGDPLPFAILSELPDLTAPTGRLEAAAVGAYVGSRGFHTADTPVEATVEDEASGVKAWFPKINDRPAAVEELLGPWSEPLVEIEVVGEDEAGNQGTAAAASLLIDDEAPEIRFRSVDRAVLRGWAPRPRDERRSTLWVSDGVATGRPLLAPGGPRRQPKWTVESEVPQVFIVPTGAWPFGEVQAAGEGRVLWIDAVDRGAGIVRMTVQVVPDGSGGGQVLRIEAADRFGNTAARELPLRGR